MSPRPSEFQFAFVIVVLVLVSLVPILSGQSARPSEVQTAHTPWGDPNLQETGALTQSTTFRAARLEGTPYPDLNGIWQAINTANWDLEPHVARPGLSTVSGPGGDVPAAPVLALGAIGGVPGGLGVVENGRIPYQPWAAIQRQDNRVNALVRDPRGGEVSIITTG